MMHKILDESLKLYRAFDQEAAIAISQESLSGYELYPTHLGEENLVLVLDGKDFFFHSPTGAVKEAKSWFKSLQLKNINLIYIYGTGLGYYYDALKDWLHQDLSRYVIFLENDLAVLKVLFSTERGLKMLQDENVIIKTVSFENNRVDISLNKSFNEIFAAFYYKKPLLTALQLYVEQHEKVLLGIKSQVYISLSWQKILHSDKEHFLGKITRNIIGNVLSSYQAASFSSVVNSFKDTPAIICGAGPSIVKDMEALKYAKKKCLMIGSGTGTNVLNKNGLFPHFFVGLDPTETQESRIRMNHSYVIPCFHKVRFSSIASKILSGERVLIRGCVSPFQTLWFDKELGIEDTDDIDTGMSSTTFALAIAKRLGCNPIILVGLDLAYTDNKRYPDGLSTVSFGSKELQDEITTKSNNLLIGKGYQGQEVLTKVDWLIESGVVTEFQMKNPEVSILNATQGGLHIDHVKNVPLEEILESLQLVDDLDGKLHALIQMKGLTVTPEKTISIVRRWLDHCRAFLVDLEKSREMAIEEFMEKEKENPFFAAFSPSLSEIERGYLYPLKIRMQRSEVMGDQEKYDQYAKEFKETFFFFWKGIVKTHLEAVLVECEKFEREPHAKVEKVFINKLTAATPRNESGYQGLCTYFGDDKPLSKTWFENGVMEGVQEKFYSSGKLFSEQTYKEGLLEGVQTFYFEDGKIRGRLEYHLGKLNNTVALYYPNGQLKREIEFKNGLQHGFEKYWDDFGTLLFISEFKEGKPFGSTYEYFSNGQPLRKTVFDGSGKRISMQEWDLSGIEIETPQSLPESGLDFAIDEYLLDMERLKCAFGDERRRLFL